MDTASSQRRNPLTSAWQLVPEKWRGRVVLLCVAFTLGYLMGTGFYFLFTQMIDPLHTAWHWVPGWLRTLLRALVEGILDGLIFQFLRWDPFKAKYRKPMTRLDRFMRYLGISSPRDEDPLKLWQIPVGLFWVLAIGLLLGSPFLIAMLWAEHVAHGFIATVLSLFGLKLVGFVMSFCGRRQAWGFFHDLQNWLVGDVIRREKARGFSHPELAPQWIRWLPTWDKLYHEMWEGSIDQKQYSAHKYVGVYGFLTIVVSWIFLGIFVWAWWIPHNMKIPG